MRRRYGFSLVEVMTASAIVTIAALAASSLFIWSKSQNERSRIARALLQNRSGVEASVENPVAWARTIQSPLNPEMGCLNQIPPTCDVNPAVGSNGFYDLTVLDMDGNNVTYDSTDPTSRVFVQGGRCPAGIADPDVQCPVKLVGRWKPLCTTPPCSKPTIYIEVEMVNDFGGVGGIGRDKQDLNKKNYSYVTFRGIDENNVEAACRSINGNYIAASNTCVPRTALESCASNGKPAQVVSRVNADGTIDCTPLYTGTCDPDLQIISGFLNNGQVACSPRVCNCVVAWGPWEWGGVAGACSAPCGGGTQNRTGVITSSPLNGGAACPPLFQSQPCNTFACPPVVDCAGNWNLCQDNGPDPNCDNGDATAPSQTFNITTPPSGGGLACPASPQNCALPACGVPIDCVTSGWGACSDPTGPGTCDDGVAPGPSQPPVITTPPSGGGAACPANQPCALAACPPDLPCIGAWGPCRDSGPNPNCDDGAAPPPISTYSWSQFPTGSGAACPFGNGDTDSAGCVGVLPMCVVPQCTPMPLSIFCRLTFTCPPGSPNPGRSSMIPTATPGMLNVTAPLGTTIVVTDGGNWTSTYPGGWGPPSPPGFSDTHTCCGGGGFPGPWTLQCQMPGPHWEETVSGDCFADKMLQTNDPFCM